MGGSVAPEPRRLAAVLVTGLCWLMVVFDGYDLIVYGAVLPALLAEPGWGLGPASAGLIGSLAFVGMMLGALGAGRLSDLWGRRTTILACTAWFSVFTALCAVAPEPEWFGVLRLLAGLGLGGLVPSASALGAEFVEPRHRSLVATLMMSGVPIGGSLASVIGIVVLPAHGWRPMFVIALVAVVVVLPLCFWQLPESPVWLRAKGRDERAVLIEQRYGLVPEPPPAGSVTVGALFRAPFRTPTVLFVLATLATLFAWFGLGTWLPQLMRTAGFDLGPALTFLLTLNLGAVAGSMVSAWGGVRFGPVRTAIAASLAAGVGLLVLIGQPGTAVTYAALVLAGIGTHGTQCLIIAAVASHYPAALRGSALGIALGVGRIGAVAAPQVGGLLLAGGFGVDSNFLVFAVAAIIAGTVLLLCPRPAPSTPQRAPGTPDVRGRR